MKSRILLIFIVFFFSGCASFQPLNEEDQIIFKRIDVPDLKKEDIHGNIIKWAADNFATGRALEQYNNSEAGLFIGSGSVPITGDNWDMDWGTRVFVYDLQYKLKIESQDGQCVVTFSNIGIDKISNVISYTSSRDLKRVEPVIFALIGEIEQYIKK